MLRVQEVVIGDPVEIGAESEDDFSEYSISFEDDQPARLPPIAEDPFAQLTPPASPRAPPQDEILEVPGTPTPPRFRHRRCPEAPLKRKRRDSLELYQPPATRYFAAPIYDLEGNATGDTAQTLAYPGEVFHFRWVRIFRGSEGVCLRKRPGPMPEIQDLTLN